MSKPLPHARLHQQRSSFPRRRRIPPIHPLADEHAMGDTHEQAAMSASIRDQGIIVPIVIWFWELKWWLLDGRNRVLCAKAVSYRFQVYRLQSLCRRLCRRGAYVEAMNGHRRHLSKEQKEERALKLIAKYPGMASRKLALIVACLSQHHCTAAQIPRRRRHHLQSPGTGVDQRKWRRARTIRACVPNRSRGDAATVTSDTA